MQHTCKRERGRKREGGEREREVRRERGEGERGEAGWINDGITIYMYLVSCCLLRVRNESTITS